MADRAPLLAPRGLAAILAQAHEDLRALITDRDERVSVLDATAAEKYIAVENLLNRKLELDRRLREIEERLRRLHQALPPPGPGPASTGRDKWGVELERVQIDRRKIIADDEKIRHDVPELVGWINRADVERRHAHRDFLTRAGAVLEHAEALVAAYLHGFNQRHPRRERVRATWRPPSPDLPPEGRAGLPPFSVDLAMLRELWRVFLALYRRPY
ncbi:hypothetical protein J5X84_15105 [Streptosporangiaceae bacterium NEAU-GS5]|nr:hypothetical protein [Streptosporangiaceae bacterium NEAU-GS5]